MSKEETLPTYYSPRLEAELKKIVLKFVDDLDKVCGYVISIEQKIDALTTRKISEIQDNMPKIKENEAEIRRLENEIKAEKFDMLHERVKDAEENQEDPENPQPYEVSSLEMDYVSESTAQFSESIKRLESKIGELKYEPEKENLLEMISFAESWQERISFPFIKWFLYDRFAKFFYEYHREVEESVRAEGWDYRLIENEDPNVTPLWLKFGDKIYAEIMAKHEKGTLKDWKLYAQTKLEQLFTEEEQKIIDAHNANVRENRKKKRWFK